MHLITVILLGSLSVLSLGEEHEKARYQDSVPADAIILFRPDMKKIPKTNLLKDFTDKQKKRLEESLLKIAKTTADTTQMLSDALNETSRILTESGYIVSEIKKEGEKYQSFSVKKDGVDYKATLKYKDQGMWLYLEGRY